jgi:hypothetical protein
MARSALGSATRLMTALVLSISCGAGALAEGTSLEAKVKAAYLSKFGNYVEWPDKAFPSPASPFILCVAGEDRFGEALDQAADGQRVGQRPVVVRRLRTVAKDSGCQILYVDGADAQTATQALDAVRGAAVLTVTDVMSATTAGAIIRFVIKDNRVRFDIDDQAAAQGGLTISSKLLSLAFSVKSRK